MNAEVQNRIKMKIKIKNKIKNSAERGILILFLLPIPSLSAAPLPPSHFTVGPTEITGYADLDGDGNADCVVVDRETGAIRVGYHVSTGNFNWAAARPGGIYEVSGVTGGRILNAARDTIALTGPVANRVHLLELPLPATVASPVLVAYAPALFGPASLAAGQISGTTAPEDLLLGSTLNGSPNNFRATLLANGGGGAFSVNSTKLITSAEIFGAARMLLKVGATHQVVYGVRVSPLTQARVLGLNEAGSPEKLAVTDLPEGARFLITPLAGSLAHVIAWVPGGTNYQFRNVAEGPPGTFTAGTPTNVANAFPIGEIIATPAGAAAKLVIVSTSGDRAILRATPDGAVEQTFLPPADSAFTGLAAADGAFGGFQFFHGATAAGRSVGARAYRFDSTTGSYTLAANQTLPAVTDLSGAGHVVVYAGEPFVAPNPGLLKRLSARDWSSSPSLGGGNVQVTAETYGGAQNGLGTPSVMNLGPAPVGATHVLASQYHPAISVFSTRAAEGGAASSLKADPGPGTYDRAVHVTLTGPAGWTIRYRTQSSDPWSLYSGPIWLHRTTKLEALGSGPGGALTPVLAAHYVFPVPDGQLSSLEDGIPDYVKIGLGFDPLVLPDRTGVSNSTETLNYLQIILDGSGVPLRHTSGAALDLHVRPHSHDGVATSNIPTLVPGALLANGEANAGNRVVVHDVSGELLDEGLADNFGHFGLGQTAAFLLRVGRAGRASVIVASTQPSFALNFSPPYDPATPFVGRELAGLIELPATTPPKFVHPYGGGSDAAEAAAWRAAAILFYQTNYPPEIGATIDSLETTVLLAFEQWLTRRFIARGLLHSSYLPTPGTLNSNRLTLTSYRPSEPALPIPDSGPITGLVLPTPEQLAGLERYLSPLDTGHRLTGVAGTLRDALRTSANPGIAALRAVTLDVYRISARWGGQFPGAFPGPVDALREFLATGVMPRAFRNDWDSGLPPQMGGLLTPLGAADYSSASNGLITLLNLPSPRPVVTRNLLVLSNSLGLTCTVLQRFDTSGLVALEDASGRPFRFPGTFDLVPGMAVKITGFADVPTNGCAAETLEVVLLGDDLQAFVTDVPLPVAGDGDGNLLDDEWELLFLGGLGNDPFASLGGGYTLLQSYLDGTDPWLPGSFMAKMPANLQLPAVQIEPFGAAQMKLTWHFHPFYANRIAFRLQTTPALGDPWSEVPESVQYLGGDEFQMVAPLNPNDSTGFWRMKLSLK